MFDVANEGFKACGLPPSHTSHRPQKAEPSWRAYFTPTQASLGILCRRPEDPNRVAAHIFFCKAHRSPQRVGCPDLSALPSCMLVNSNLYFPPPLLPPALPPALPPGDQWAVQGGPPPSDPGAILSSIFDV